MSYVNFEQLLSIKGTTTYKVAKETGISNSTFSDWKNGRSTPKLDKMQKIAAYFDVPLERLMGEDFLCLEDFESAPRHSGATRVPIVGEIRAGAPIVTNETLLGYETAEIGRGEDKSDYFFLSVRGDSMKDCGMVDGSLVLFRKQQYADEGNIVACLVGDDSATVKRFHREGRRILLMPENEEYEPIELTPEDFEAGSARILGVAKELKIRF